MPVYLQEGRHFLEEEMKLIIFFLFIVGIVGFLLGGFAGDVLIRKKGLRFGRRFVGMTGLGMCGACLLLAGLTSNNYNAAYYLIAGNGFFSFGVMVSYAVCTDIGRNNAGTVTGAMNFFGQMGAFFLAIIFGKILQMTGNYDYPIFVVAAVMFTGCLLWTLIDPLKQVKNIGDKKIETVPA
jgi:sugar phosphate permease